MVLSLAVSCSSSPSDSDGDDDVADEGGGGGNAAGSGGGGAGGGSKAGGSGGSPAGGSGGSQAGGSGGSPSGGSGGTQAGGSGGSQAGGAGGSGGASVGGMGGGQAQGGMPGTGGTGTGGTNQGPPPAAEGPGVMFSGLSPNISKVVAADAKPGYMGLFNGVTKSNVQEIPIEPKEVSDPALPAGTKYALWSRTEDPGAVNLIWNINFRADKGNGGKRADWQPLDVSGYEGFEFYAKSSLARGFNAALYSGASGYKSSGTNAITTSWRRIRLNFEQDFSGASFDPKALGRIDILMHVENSNPAIEWSITGVRLLTKAQFDGP